MPRADLQVWAITDYIEPIFNTSNKLDIPEELYDKGWLLGNPVAGQHLNTLFNEITYVLKEETLDPAQNLNDLDNKATARSNLDVLQKSANLSDIPSKATARQNLDVSQTNDVLLKAGNLSGISNVATARDNLGLNIDTLFNTFFDKVYPVGTIYENETNSANPATYLGRGTWVAHGAGRVTVGVGTTTDSRGESLSFATSGASGGEFKHAMTTTEMVSHTHRLLGSLAGSASVNALAGNFIAGDNDATGAAYTNSGSESRQLVESTGSGTPFNVTQPYVVVYRWKRTA